MKKPFVILFSIAFIICGLSGLSISDNIEASPLADSPWPCSQGNARHTGLSQYDTSGNDGTLRWIFPTEGAVASPAIGDDGTIFVGSEDSNLYAIKPGGLLKWKYQAGPIESTPAIDSDGKIFVKTTRYGLYKINKLGYILSSYNGGGSSSPIIDSEGIMYVGNNYDMGSINTESGGPTSPSFRWAFSCTDQVTQSPAIGLDGTIYIGAGHKFHAINPDQTEKWNFTLGEKVGTSPTIADDGTIYFGTASFGPNKLYALNPDGTEKWNFTVGESINSSPAIIGNRIYFGCTDNKLYALNSDGTQDWNYTTGGAIYSSPAIGVEGTIYFGSWDNNVYALNPEGSLKWNYTTGGKVESSPAIGSDGTVYIGSDDGNLYAFGQLGGGIGDSPICLPLIAFIIAVVVIGVIFVIKRKPKNRNPQEGEIIQPQRLSQNQQPPLDNNGI